MDRAKTTPGQDEMHTERPYVFFAVLDVAFKKRKEIFRAATAPIANRLEVQ